jgi:hypothetical protein
MNPRVDKEAVKATVENAAFAEWRLPERDRFVIRYEFASRQWSGCVEPFNDLTGEFGERRDLAPVQMETLKRFFDFVLSRGQTGR